jgi:ATP/maltotriose-dependent transcriptional regulator MalT
MVPGIGAAKPGQADIPMKQHRHENEFYLGQSFIAASENRISRQKQLIEHLKRKGRPTEIAEAVLKQFEASLQQLHNHVEVMQELMRPDKPPLRMVRPDE